MRVSSGQTPIEQPGRDATSAASAFRSTQRSWKSLNGFFLFSSLSGSVRSESISCFRALRGEERVPRTSFFRLSLSSLAPRFCRFVLLFYLSIDTTSQLEAAFCQPIEFFESHERGQMEIVPSCARKEEPLHVHSSERSCFFSSLLSLSKRKKTETRERRDLAWRLERCGESWRLLFPYGLFPCFSSTPSSSCSSFISCLRLDDDSRSVSSLLDFFFSLRRHASYTHSVPA